MSDTYLSLYYLVTEFLPKISIVLVFTVLLLGAFVKFIRQNT